MENDVKFYKEARSDFSFTHKQLAFTIRVPEIRIGIDHMINQYGTLYYGTLLPTLFSDAGKNGSPIYTTKNDWVHKLSDIENCISLKEVERITFLL